MTAAAGAAPQAVGTAGTPGPRRWLRRAAVAAAALGCAVAAALLAARFTGAADPDLLADPGAGVRWGLPVLGVLVDLSAALTVGTLVVAATCLPVPAAGRAHRPAMLLAAVAAGAWTLAAVVRAVAVFAEVSATPLADPGFGSQLWQFLTDVDLGRGMLATVLLAAAVATLTAGAASLTAAGLAACLALVALIPPALAGHAAGSSDHETAVTALGLHLLGVTVWTGGLVALVLLGGGLGDRLGAAVRRFSALAGWCFALVAGSGVVSAWLRLGAPSGLGTRYGAVVVAKSVALVGLGVLGRRQRRRVVARLDPDDPGTARRLFHRLAAVELLLLGTATGLAATLARSVPPALPAAVPDPARSLTGYPMPPAPTAGHWFTLWQPDLLWLLVVGLAAAGYAVGVRRLHRRGDRWSVGRTICWFAGLAVVLYATCGAPVAYGRVLFSAHMAGHLTLSMLAPLLLVVGAPVTLLLRAVPGRRDGSRGPREWLLVAVESRYARLLTRPAVAAVLFTGSLFAFYFSPLFELALRTHLGHEAMDVHFLASGYLFAWVLVGVDPGPRRSAPPVRLLVLLATMAFHAFFAVAVMSSRTVLAADYFAAVTPPWGSGPLPDQHTGGAVTWALGDLPTLALALVIAIQWARSDDREARRLDRAADRDGDAALTEYNAMLARLAGRPADRR